MVLKKFSEIKCRIKFFFQNQLKNVILNHFWFNEDPFWVQFFRTFLRGLQKEFFIEPSEMVQGNFRSQKLQKPCPGGKTVLQRFPQVLRKVSPRSPLLRGTLQLLNALYLPLQYPQLIVPSKVFKIAVATADLSNMKPRQPVNGIQMCSILSL